MDKQPPANVITERDLLGALLIAPKAQAAVAFKVLEPRDFHDAWHRWLFVKLKNCHENEPSGHWRNRVPWMKLFGLKKKAEWSWAIRQLLWNPIVANIPGWVEDLRELRRKRAERTVSLELFRAAMNGAVSSGQWIEECEKYLKILRGIPEVINAIARDKQ